jgi:Lon protease-like protein
MSRATFNPTYDQLPRALPIFPLPGALLLPGGHLPLNIFEPRYIEMFDAALAGERMIGITTFSETTDGRYEVTLLGLIRFDIAEELPPKSYRSVRPDFGRFAPDLEENDAEIDRVRLLTALKTYFHAKTIQSDWQAIEQAENDRLVTALAMLCPLESWEKQLLLEAETLDKRAEVLTAILEMAIRGDDEEVLRH